MICAGCKRSMTNGFCPWCGNSNAQDPPELQGSPGVLPLAPDRPRGFGPTFSRFIVSAWGGFIRWLAWAGKALGEAQRTQEHGKVNAALICPHCQAKGSVRSKRIDRKTGISGGKIAAAVLLSPLTLLATGVSRNERATQAHCDHCGSTWTF